MKNLRPEKLSLERMTLSEAGNPGNPQGESGEAILERMNISHYDFTGWALEQIKIPASGNIIDLGCGGGLTLKRLSAESANSKLFGLDFSDVSVAKSSETNKDDIASGKMNILKASIDNMPFEDNHFDLVTSFETIYFWADHIKTLKEIKRVMKKGSVFLLASEAYDHEGLSQTTRDVLKRKGIFNPSYTEYQNFYDKAGFSKYQILTKEGTDWICVLAIK